MGYINLDLKVIADLGDLDEAVLLCFLLGQKENNNVKTIQKWQQTEIAKIMCIGEKKVRRKLESLQEKGYLTYRASTYKNAKTTQITLSENALKFKNDGQKTKEVLQSSAQQKTFNHQANISEDILTTNKVVKISRAQQYLNYINKSIGL